MNPTPSIATTPDTEALIAMHVPVAIGVSGGKDSQAAALATIDYLNQRGHAGPRLLIHSDLGAVEWTESLPVCQRLADYLQLDLIVVRRPAGDLMDRWESRWASSVRRYANLDTVTLVLPWSTPSLRFCTSEMKTHLIQAELRRRFPRQRVLNVTGVRREESASRAKGSIANADPNGSTWHWRPLSDWTQEQVFALIAAHGLSLHQAYTEFGMSRVSCRYCIMSSLSDLRAAAAIPESHALYRRMVQLEITSTFAFQGTRWLGDIAPELLSSEMQHHLTQAKTKAAQRIHLEHAITPDMRYQKGWPTKVLTNHEAHVLAQVRRAISDLIPFEANYLTPSSIQEHYAQRMANKPPQGKASTELHMI